MGASPWLWIHTMDADIECLLKYLFILYTIDIVWILGGLQLGLSLILLLSIWFTHHKKCITMLSFFSSFLIIKDFRNIGRNFAVSAFSWVIYIIFFRRNSYLSITGSYSLPQYLYKTYDLELQSFEFKMIRCFYGSSSKQ